MIGDERTGAGRDVVGAVSNWLLERSLREPRRVLVLAGLITVVLGSLFVRVEIDTDPENMLSADTPVRVANRELRDTFGGGEMIVVGLFGPDEISADELTAAVDFHDALAMTDGVDESALVSVRTAIGSDEGIPTPGELATRLAKDPLLGGNVLSVDGDTLAFFVALDDKSDALDVRDAANDLLDADGDLASLERHIGGLPLAQEAFGAQMFVQMAVFAPLAGLAIFVLMLVFFRRLVLVGPAMVLAMLSVVWAMGLLIGTGNTLHIMSSMIPIFLMPIAILDAIHVISEFFDRYREERDRSASLRAVYAELFHPIAYTTITTGTGFAALALTPIPPVRVFGIFVAIGVVIAWLATLTVLPAILMLVRESSIEKAVGAAGGRGTTFERVVAAIPDTARRGRVPVLAAAGAIVIAAVPLLTTIQVNDNPVNWFRSGHEVRVATERLNDELPGTFGANLVLRAEEGELLDPETIEAVRAMHRTLGELEVVGAVSSYVDLIGDADGGTSAALALDEARRQSPLTSSLITDDGSAANVRLQLRSGDNQAMQEVLDAAGVYLELLPAGVEATWAGESYLNLVWQDEMVAGMIVGFLVTLAVILVLLVALFRSVRWALLAVAPVLWTIAVVYAVIGLVGKDFDMPIAVLSTMVLGIGVDFAIHFVQRVRHLRDELGSMTAALDAFAGEPARALTRNAAVIAIGFMPLLASSLTPYVIVAIFLASIIVLSWFTTMVVLPAVCAFSER